MKSLGRCCCLLNGGQCVSKPGNGLHLLFNLPVFHFKLSLQRVNSGL
ncbi:MAG TPA: hypothetical protein H9844_05135 [Candidatus Evtepia faecigallinarum]|nr:hypothetical protein [Candidatus Evtepia faecigallinarum]